VRQNISLHAAFRTNYSLYSMNSREKLQWAKNIAEFTISHVVNLCSKVKMLWVKAFSIVAFVKGIQWRIFFKPKPQDCRKAIRLIEFSSNSKSSISLLRDMTNKFPATIGEYLSMGKKPINLLLFSTRNFRWFQWFIHFSAKSFSHVMKIAKSLRTIFMSAIFYRASFQRCSCYIPFHQFCKLAFLRTEMRSIFSRCNDIEYFPTKRTNNFEVFIRSLLPCKNHFLSCSQ